MGALFTLAPETPKTINIQVPTSQLDTMHHYIPPPESPILDLLANMFMHDGKRARAQRVVADMLMHIHAMTNSQPMPIVQEAIFKAAPAVRCKKLKRNGGSTTDFLPMPLSERQRTAIGIRWIYDAVKAKGVPGKTLAQRLAKEMVAIIGGSSTVLKKKEDMHKEAMVNRFALSLRSQSPYADVLV